MIKGSELNGKLFTGDEVLKIAEDLRNLVKAALLQVDSSQMQTTVCKIVYVGNGLYKIVLDKNEI